MVEGLSVSHEAAFLSRHPLRLPTTHLQSFPCPACYRCQRDRDGKGKGEVKTVIGGLYQSLVVEGSEDEALAGVMMPVKWEGFDLAPTLT